MYKVAIIYTGVAYESEVNNIRLQELLGKIKVIGIGTPDIYAKNMDGYPVTSMRKYFESKLGLPFSCRSGTKFCRNKKIVGKRGGGGKQDLFNKDIFFTNV